jgi:hypothetical protein
MKSPAAKLILVALLATPLIAQAQFQPAPPDRYRDLTLLPGPGLLSPATATGKVAPGQEWTLRRVVSPPRLVRGFTSADGTLSSPKLVISSGTLTLATSREVPAGNFVQRAGLLPEPPKPDSLRFDMKMPPAEIRPLQTKPAPAPADIKSL